MIPEEKLPNLFDVLCKGKYESARPTECSIERINSHFGMNFPVSLVRFMQASKYYAEQFCLFDESYQSYFHIIRTNSLYKNIRRRRHGRWRYVMPRSFVLIKSNPDDRHLALDTSKYNPVTGEFGLQYWFPGYEKEFGDSYPDFNTYMRSLIEYLLREADEVRLAACEAILAAP
ncbi:hypothetical protein O5O45_15690 [Hahella aquimaris]|uniref:hypothetical protein n=1 Tax=Hahella sp. HNIBRBA332 TaxID=3015983 RepID=UPI00273BB72D|nr:hypothetical protein [Hahella sp. HNIBRBA332]WLQ17355.1 hypothetical protein O5O45_15690 [Hahella sp. HNIBRBA332]